MFKYAVCLFSICFSMSGALAQRSKVTYHDIDNIHLEKMIAANDSTPELKFQNFALRLFMEGTSVDESYFEELDRKIIGVCLMRDTNEAARFNLYALNYGEVEENWPVTAGSKGVASFFVKCNNQKEEAIVEKAVDSYLRDDVIPVNNLAYKFCNEYEFRGNEYVHIYPTKGISAVMPGDDYSLYRKNGNYVIEIAGNVDDQEQEKSTGAHFSTHWLVMAVYIIDQTSGKAYGRKF